MSDDKRIDFVLEEIRELRKDFKEMNDVLAVNTESLRTHIRRTELLEQAALKMDGRIGDLEIKKIESEAVKKWIKDKILLSAKIIGALVAATTLIAMIPSFIKWLIH